MRASLTLWLSACAIFTFIATNAVANGIGENSVWQFETSADRSVNTGVADLVGRYNGGYYQQWNVNNTYNTYNSTTTNVAGSQTNCNLNAVATGNSGTTTGSASTASPVVSSVPNTYATSTGNSTLGTSYAGTAANPAYLNATQGNYTSPVSASVSGTTSTASAGYLTTSGSTSSQVLNSTQSNASSPQTSTVSNSSACSGVAFK